MDNWQVWLLITVAIVVIVAGVIIGVRQIRKPRRPEATAKPETQQQSTVDDSASDTSLREDTVAEPDSEASAETKTEVEVPEPTAGRLVRLRSRLSRSNNAVGRGLLALLARDRLDDDTWEEIEDTLLAADVGVEPTQQIVERMRERTRVLGTRTSQELRQLLTEELETVLDPQADRSLAATGTQGRPAVILVVGVNGAGKTTTCGKIARVLVADGHDVVLGAADTFRAAAADQLQTWGERVGSQVIRGPEGADPASVAFDAVRQATENKADTVLVDTAGRLQNKSGLMDELGKVKRVIEKHGPVDETLLILDATTGQNGLEQARVFTEVCDVSGVVLTKLDGTAKGGIVIAVQRQLGVPVKLIGLGEGSDDLAPFNVTQFVEALLDEDLANGGDHMSRPSVA